jgi:hypothetical protein
MSQTKPNLPRDSKGKLPAYTWPGAYPIFYLTKGNNILCAECANENDEDYDPIVAADANYEDPTMYCNECNGRIESAYAEDD